MQHMSCSLLTSSIPDQDFNNIPQYCQIIPDWTACPIHGYMKHLIWLEFLSNLWVYETSYMTGLLYQTRRYLKHFYLTGLLIQSLSIWNILSDWTAYPTHGYMKHLIWLDCSSNPWVYETSYLTGLLYQALR